MRNLVAVALALSMGSAGSLAFSTVRQDQPSISGTLRDPHGVGIPRAQVELSVSGGTVKRSRTDREGRFVFQKLRVGEYELRVALVGFRTNVVSVAVQSQHVLQDVILEFGGMQERVIVRGTDRPSPPAQRDGGETRIQPCAAVAHGGHIGAPVKVRHVRPTYPAELLKAGITGHVLLQGRLGLDGRPENLRVGGDAHAQLQTAALTAVSEWRFVPTSLNCQPVEIDMRVVVEFRVS